MPGSESNACALVFIHLGPVIPSYTALALAQARLFNRMPIFLVASAAALSNFPLESALAIERVSCESLPLSASHEHFEQTSTLDRVFRNGFWTYTTERFFYLEALMHARALERVFYLENDVTLYVDLELLLPVFTRYYQHIAATFDNDDRCIPGFLFVRHAHSLAPLTDFIAKFFDRSGRAINDMALIAGYRKVYGAAAIDLLPIVPPNPAHPLGSQAGHRPADPALYSNFIEDFDSIFDAAALGQYLGGADPLNSGGKETVGFINASCVFNPSHYEFTAQIDALGRSIPFLHTPDRNYRINTLHIHSKNLAEFIS